MHENDRYAESPMVDYINAVRRAGGDRQITAFALLVAAMPFVAIAWFAWQFPVMFALFAIIGLALLGFLQVDVPTYAPVKP